MPLAHLIVGQQVRGPLKRSKLAVDEHQLETTLIHQTLINPITGSSITPANKAHPMRRIFKEEVYYASMVHDLLSDKQVTLLDAVLSNVPKLNEGREEQIPAFRGPSRGDIYHDLKHRAWFYYLIERADKYLSLPARAAFKCRPLVQSPPQNPPAVCCAHWKLCKPRRAPTPMAMPRPQRAKAPTEINQV
eukprot:CAMPEP_0181172290 /NCGR_PEP_ID=MMETSP1096-20121128/2371_1 /TAXON_ID=156174 ORGANISM="Chrysochromulina ericina, Strain CCMP281" /NCGR_SAMPLE_ID=MMETSP1096 /ASSEMBLY_ACC=CAM_ASM_000453 /LENGTH=189 /DNA_ID=CAMNT_0023260009 /DNA_START=25 /DNA_END=595 /DNA_ORIENTATION=-